MFYLLQDSLYHLHANTINIYKNDDKLSVVVAPNIICNLDNRKLLGDVRRYPRDFWMRQKQLSQEELQSLLKDYNGSIICTPHSIFDVYNSRNEFVCTCNIIEYLYNYEDNEYVLRFTSIQNNADITIVKEIHHAPNIHFTIKSREWVGQILYMRPDVLIDYINQGKHSIIQGIGYTHCYDVQLSYIKQLDLNIYPIEKVGHFLFSESKSVTLGTIHSNSNSWDDEYGEATEHSFSAYFAYSDVFLLNVLCRLFHIAKEFPKEFIPAYSSFSYCLKDNKLMPPVNSNIPADKHICGRFVFPDGFTQSSFEEQFGIHLFEDYYYSEWRS